MTKPQTLYRATSSKDTSITLKHFGSIDAACSRAISAFGGQCQYKPLSEKQVLFAPDNGLTKPEILSVEEFTDKFVAHMESWSVQVYLAQENRTLELNDVWADDPIGSGGMAIFESTKLTSQERQELWSIFKPFKNPIYPHQLSRKYTEKEIKRLPKKLMANRLGRKEFIARKQRAWCNGEDFSQSRFQEAVWVDLTLKLRRWAIANDYNAFAYRNYEEGTGCWSYVPLSENCLLSSSQQLTFCRDKYLELAKRKLPKLLKKASSGKSKFMDIRDLMCCGKAPSSFWV